MRRRVSLAAACLAVALAWGPGLARTAAADAAATLPDPRDPGLAAADRLPTLVERIRLENQALETLEARFKQVKTSTMLLEPSLAHGTFSYAAPDSVLWEYESPDPIALLIRGEEMVTWYKDLDQAERASVGRHSQKVLEYLGASTSLQTMLEYFSVYMHTPDDPTAPYKLDLEPRYERIAKRLQRIQIWIDSETFMVAKIRYVEADEDVTEYEFEEMRLNGNLPERTFELDIPPSVDVREIELGRRSGQR